MVAAGLAVAPLRRCVPGQVEWHPRLLEVPARTRLDYAVTDLSGGPRPPSPYEENYKKTTFRVRVSERCPCVFPPLPPRLAYFPVPTPTLPSSFLYLGRCDRGAADDGGDAADVCPGGEAEEELRGRSQLSLADL